MDFAFYQVLSGRPVTIVSGTFYECDHSDCRDAKPLVFGGPQHFDCTSSSCHALAYGFAPYHRLAIRFSDGRTRRSNVFHTAAFESVYRVTVQANALEVEPQPGMRFFVAATIVTIAVEDLVVLAYSLWRKKPTLALLLSSTGVNIMTQLGLWLTLNVSFHDYVATLFAAEYLIWVAEGLAMHLYRPNHLRWREAMLLSLAMNLTSLSIGWFLPV